MPGDFLFMDKITQKWLKRLTYNDVPAQIFFGEYQNISQNFNDLYVDLANIVVNILIYQIKIEQKISHYPLTKYKYITIL